MAIGAQVLGQLEAVTGSDLALDAPQRGRAALKLLGGSDHGVPGGQESVDHDPAGGLDGHRKVLGSAVAGQSGHGPVDAGSVGASVQRSTRRPVSSITVTSCRWLA